MNQYVELQKLKDPDRFSFEIEVDENLESDAVLIPSMLIQPFLENSIEHGFSSIDYKGVLSLELMNNDENLFITIKDNGSGLKVKGSESKHISRATQITRDRLYLLQKDKKGNASFDVQENLSGGVIVHIVLPLIYK
jgi:LytS/YehU family sensor histidine kinase